MGRIMRILGISDVHGNAEGLCLLKRIDADIVAVCGDLHNMGTFDKAQPVVEALADLERPVLIIPGNMDPREFASKLWEKAGFINLHEQSYIFQDYGFIGFGGIVPKSMKFDDKTRYYHRDEDVYEALARLHEEIDGMRRRIVMTHQPPRGILATIHSGEITGCVSLRRFIEEYQPDLLICGHIHEAWGEAQLGATKIVNLGEMRKGYCAIIEIDDDISVRWIAP